METPYKRLVFVDEYGTVEEQNIDRCIPEMNRNTIRLYQIGGTLKAVFQPATVAQGVSTKAVCDYNRSTGWTLDTPEIQQRRQEESKKCSASRTKRIIRELAACNPWSYFVTITLDPAKWNRVSPEGLQVEIRELAKRWRRKNRKGISLCPGFVYLFIPERHKDGAIHLHGIVNSVPASLLLPYTIEQVQSKERLPHYICQRVTDGKPIYHCAEWDSLFGYNLLEPIEDNDRMASYITKYISKDIENSEFPSRYWCSRGLRRAEPLCVYRMESTIDPKQQDKDIMRYDSFIREKAVRTGRGTALHKMQFSPAFDRQHQETGTRLSSITTYINSGEHSESEIIDYCREHFIEVKRKEVP